MAITKHHITGGGFFTLIELLVVVAIISILMALLLPALGRAKELGRATICRGNQKQIGLAVYSYANDHSGFIPPFWNADSGQVWCRRLYENGYVSPSAKTPNSPLVCPTNLGLAEKTGNNISNCWSGTYGVSMMIGYYYYTGTYYYSGTGSTYKLLHKLDNQASHFYIADKIFAATDSGSKYSIKTNLPETWPPNTPKRGNQLRAQRWRQLSFPGRPRRMA